MCGGEASCCPRSGNVRVRVYELPRVTSGLFRPRAGELDDLAPFFRFFGHEFTELRRRNGKDRRAKVGKPRLQLGIGKARVDLLVELVDDVSRRVPGRANA